MHLCVDLREVNKAVIPDVYPIPPIQELLCELHDAKVFSQLDMKSAYHQLELHPNSRDLTAFITHDGLYIRGFVLACLPHLQPSRKLCLLSCVV